MKNENFYLFKSFGWSVISKLLLALIQFVSIPLLLNYFGRDYFGLLTLSLSINAYLSIIEMGVNVGGLKFYAELIQSQKYDLLDSVARTGISFYSLIGLLNSLLVIFLAFFGLKFFHVSIDQESVLRNICLILALFSIVNWCTSVFNQLIVANDGFSFIQQINIIKNVLIFALLGITIQCHFNLTEYFFWFSLINGLVIIPLYIRSKNQLLITSFIPAFDWQNFRLVFKYSLAIFGMSVFQMTATQLRPVILSLYSINGVEILADYRIIETIILFIISIGGVFTSILLPKATKVLFDGNNEEIQKFACRTTLYITIICLLLAIPFVLSGKEILTIYVGAKYLYLYPWMIIWIFTIIFQLHTSPMASLILTTGKTKMLVYISAIACFVSLLITAVFTSWWGVGSAIIGYAVYILIFVSSYYWYFNIKILNLNSWKIFKSFLVPFLLGVGAMIIVFLLNFDFTNLIVLAVLKTAIWIVLFFYFLFMTKTIKLVELPTIFKSYRIS